MEDRFIIGVDLSKSEDKSSLAVARILNNNSMQIVSQFYGKEAEIVYETLTGTRKRTDNIFDLINAHANGYEKAVNEMKRYSFYNEEKDKIVVLNKEKLLQEYHAIKVIFEEEDMKHE